MKLISPLKTLDAAPRQSSSLKLLLFLALGAGTALTQATGGTGTSGGGTTGVTAGGGTGAAGGGTGTAGSGTGTEGSGTGTSASAGDVSTVQGWMSVQGKVQNGALLVHFSRKDMGNTNLQGSQVSNELVADGAVAFYPLADFTLQSSGATGGTTPGSSGSTSGSSGSGSATSGSASGSSGASGSGSTGTATSGSGSTAGASASPVYDPFGILYQTASLNTSGGPWYLMTAEIPLLEKEVNPFLRQLNRSDISVAAVHNHYITDNPRLVFVHLEGVVNQARVQIFKSAIAVTGIRQITDGTENAVNRLNQNQIGSILGGTASGSADVVDVMIPRDEQFSSCLPALDQMLFNRESQGTSIAQGSSGQFGASASAGSTGATGSTGSSSGSAGSTAAGSSSGNSGSGSTTFTAATGTGSSADWLTSSGCNATVGSSFAGANGGTATSTGTAGTTGVTGSAGTGNVSMGPIQIPNEMLAFSEIRIQADGNGQGFLVGELALLPSELDLTRRSLISQGFQVSAVHNHSATISPDLLFLHIAKKGNAAQMAQIVRQAMDQNRVAAGSISATGNSNGGTGTTGGTGSTGTGTTGTGTAGGGTTGTGGGPGGAA